MYIAKVNKIRQIQTKTPLKLDDSSFSGDKEVKSIIILPGF